MAHKKDVIARAKDLYCLQGKSIAEISAILHIPTKTITNWRNKDDWDTQIAVGGTLTTYLELYKKFMEQVKAAIDGNTLDNSQTADALLKNAKLLEKLMPDSMMLSNMYSFLKDLTEYFTTHIDDRAFIDIWQEHIEPIGDFLRQKYAGRFK